MIDKDGNPKLTDFGFAFNDRYQLSMPDQIVGTPQYMSPQLVQGLTQNLDGRTDIWSLGVILYEFLVKERPFEYPDTDDFNKIARLIETKDPKPLRQIDSSIDSKLEYICMKCLSKQARHRYDIAQDLADQLRRWVSEQDESQRFSSDTFKPRKIPILPKGLRSYGPEDAASFLQLLPGPRDYSGVPSSVRFWQVRIVEPVAEENRIPVGVIYGPSGSGKSSFVKAGLIPNLSENVEHIYVEATREDTEVRILKALRRKFPAIPENLSLPETFHGISFGEWETGKKKLLIVLDQFEQRLSNNDPYGQSQLARALRHCDGQKIQCLLLIRDDFWLGLTRFADALEMDLLEGHNSQDIDLLDKKHACYVLMRLGQAYDCLRSVDEFEELESEQQKFIAEVVNQLAVGNYIICVRLTLFAELFKDREWSLAELKRVGGAKGVGETFLESTYGSESRTKKYQLQRDSAQSVLEALLPEAGTDIRGSMKTESELQNGAGLENRPDKFRELVKTLDQELKLITRTSPDESPDELANEAKETAGHFQLTHDYLVPSVRNWLTAEQRTTFRGRKRLQLTAMANHYIESEDPRQLPNWFDYAYATLGLTDLKAKPRFANYWRAGRRKFIGTSGIVSAAIIVLLILGIGLVNREKDRQVDELLTLAINCHASQFEEKVEQLVHFKSRVVTQIRGYQEDKDASNNEKLHLRMIKLLFDDKLDKETDETKKALIDLVAECDSNQCDNILMVINEATARKELIEEIAKQVGELPDFDRKARFVTLLVFLAKDKDHQAIKVIKETLLEPNSDVDFRTHWIHKFGDWKPTISTNVGKSIRNCVPLEMKGYLIQALGLIRKENYQRAERDELHEVLDDAFKNDDNSLIHSSAKYSLLRLFGELPKFGKGERNKINWYVNEAGATFLRITQDKYLYQPQRVQHDLYVMDSEVSTKLFAQFWEERKKGTPLPLDKFTSANLKHPANPVTPEMGFEFCNWLNTKEQDNRQLENCYAKTADGDWEFDFTKNGFRLPFFVEYDAITRLPDRMLFNFGGEKSLTKFGDSYLKFDSKTMPGSKNKPGKIFERLPNSNGLFDVRGNVQEWCFHEFHERFDPRQQYQLYGGSYLDSVYNLMPTNNAHISTGNSSETRIGDGIRPVRKAN